MLDRRRRANDPFDELLSTVGLVGLVGAVVGGVISLVALGSGAIGPAGAVGSISVLVFGASLLAFAADSRRSSTDVLPFPSLLRGDAAAPPADVPAAAAEAAVGH